MTVISGRYKSLQCLLIYRLKTLLARRSLFTMARHTQMAIYTWVNLYGFRLTVGHALNKILKDIILRYNILQGRKVSYIPGWDCHGLPIELKAVKSKPGKELSAPIIRNIARKFAEKTVLKQMEGFREWAVTGDWENRWCTMDREYEVRQLEVFLEMVKRGHPGMGHVNGRYDLSSITTSVLESKYRNSPSRSRTRV